MGFFSQDIKNMDDLFMHTLRDIYYRKTDHLRPISLVANSCFDSLS
jgi:ferritin-like metal-binding protein YciE